MAPNPMPDLGQQTLVDEALYLVQADEIMATMTSVKLVIISGGWSVVSRKGLSASQALVSTFLSAGKKIRTTLGVCDGCFNPVDPGVENRLKISH